MLELNKYYKLIKWPLWPQRENECKIKNIVFCHFFFVLSLFCILTVFSVLYPGSNYERSIKKKAWKNLLTALMKIDEWIKYIGLDMWQSIVSSRHWATRVPQLTSQEMKSLQLTRSVMTADRKELSHFSSAFYFHRIMSWWRELTERGRVERNDPQRAQI